VLGEAEALRRLEGIHDLIRRDDVDYVSVKVSAIASHISMWAFDQVVDRVVDRLLPLYLTAASAGPESAQTFINLDMEEYRDLDLTIAVFTRLLEDPRPDLEAGIVLQAYLPDALPALRQLTAWAQQRSTAGAPASRCDSSRARTSRWNGWMPSCTAGRWPPMRASSTPTPATCGASTRRCGRRTRARCASASPATTSSTSRTRGCSRGRGVRDDVEFEMLLGMAQGQVAAVSREVGHVLLYVPVVRPDEFDVAISYLVRRLEENASSDNFLSAAFDLAEDPRCSRGSATASSPRCSGRPTPRFPSGHSARRRGGTTDRAAAAGTPTSPPARIGDPRARCGARRRWR
jgi:RHH-type proline utilization regulon transcriptional repressor/proline dehydrogenase/delta 1-pyrroline-5-carboxylate dehydrogenase